ncbi:MAG: diphthamide biosynthesis enzyme Dph2 [Methanolinea sp.]|nr:diphthamide biosynthesis enzyme Dph2 [Methanolinea sp.]
MTGYSELAGRIRDRGAHVVALQFPAGLKRRAGEIATALRKEGFDVILSGDPCYGACDLALETLEYADLLVHFGHTPIGKEPHPVLYEPYFVDFDLNVLEHALPLLQSQTIGLVTTAQHIHLIPGMREFLAEKGICTLVTGGSRGCAEAQVLGCAFSAARIPGAGEILFVGTGVFHPLGVQLATGRRVIALDPLSGEAAEVDAERFLRRRMALIEKARASESIGFLVSTKPGQNRYPMARDMESRAKNAFIILMDEISPDELLNLGFGAYVNFACPRLAYDDQVRFPVPVLTPGEFEILLGLRAFEEYSVDEMG